MSGVVQERYKNPPMTRRDNIWLNKCVADLDDSSLCEAKSCFEWWMRNSKHTLSKEQREALTCWVRAALHVVNRELEERSSGKR